MHESFHALNEVKQEKIINAAMQVFSQKPYGKACTDDIAAIAEISKELLFYHFKNKRDLYCYLYEYCCNELYNIHFKNNIDISKFGNIEDVNRALKLLVWLSEGLLRDVEKAGKLDLNELQDEFDEYMKVLKRGFYKQKEL